LAFAISCSDNKDKDDKCNFLDEEIRFLNEAIIDVEEQIIACFGHEGIGGCPDISQPVANTPSTCSQCVRDKVDSFRAKIRNVCRENDYYVANDLVEDCVNKWEAKAKNEGLKPLYDKCLL